MRRDTLSKLYKILREVARNENPKERHDINIAFWKSVSKWSFDLTKNTVLIVSIAVSARKTGIYSLYVPALLLGFIQLAEINSQIDYGVYIFNKFIPRLRWILMCFSTIGVMSLYLLSYLAVLKLAEALNP